MMFLYFGIYEEEPDLMFPKIKTDTKRAKTEIFFYVETILLFEIYTYFI